MLYAKITPWTLQAVTEEKVILTSLLKLNPTLIALSDLFFSRSDHMPKLPSTNTFLWIDCCAAFLSGAVVASIKSQIAPLLGLSEMLLTTLSMISIAYGCYSFSLALLKSKRKETLYFLVGANFTYAVLCFALAIMHCCANWWGVGYLMAESLVVAVLAAFEWKRFSSLFSK